MSPDATLYARLVTSQEQPLPPARQDALADAAESLTRSVRDVTEALREACAALEGLNQGRRGAAARLGVTLARAEMAAARQAARTRALLAALD